MTIVTVMQPSIRITVIVAVYNGASTIRQCIDSITRQTYSNRELIVIDGGSNDGTVQILEQYASKLSFWQSSPDRGIYDAWNQGLDHASGDWICFLGADDYLWNDTVMERLEPHLRTAAPARVVYGRVAVVNKTNQISRYDGVPWEEARRSFGHTLTVPHPGLMHHRSVFAEHGKFDDSFRIAGDYDLLLRELRTRNALFAPEVITVGMRHGGLSNSPSIQGQVLKELSRIRKKHGIRAPLVWSRVRLKMTLCAWTVRCVGERRFRLAADWLRKVTGRPPVWTEDAER